MTWFDVVKLNPLGDYVESESKFIVDNSDLSFITIKTNGGDMNGEVQQPPLPTNVAIVNDIYINNRNRGKGLGKKLVEEFKNALPPTVDTIRGHVVDPAAKPFWVKMGLTLDKEITPPSGEYYSVKFR